MDSYYDQCAMKIVLTLILVTLYNITLTNIVTILMISAKMTTLGLLRYFEINFMTLQFLSVTSSRKIYHVTQIIS